jgi:hypothetical protein
MSKRPITPLSIDVPKGQGAEPEPAARPPTAEVPTAPAAPLRTAMTYRPTVATHDRLRTIAFRRRRSMQDLVDEAVAAWLATQQD